MSETPAQILADAIREHRDTKYHGGTITDPADGHLYAALVWFETWTDHAADPEAVINED